MKMFEDKVAAMYAPFSEYVPKVTQLMIFHIWDLAKRSGISADEQMKKVAWLARLASLDTRVTTDISSLHEWKKVKSKLCSIIDSCIDESHTSIMEQRGFDILLPSLTPRFQPNYVFPKKSFHHVWYTMHEENKLVAVHFINANMPKSPFEDVKEFASHFLMAIEDACSKFPAIQQVECGTWMNEVPRFLQLWPASYHNNRHHRENTGGFGPGWWGQYLTSSGKFNEKAGKILRSTSKHQYPLSIGYCPVKDILTHLRDFIG